MAKTILTVKAECIAVNFRKNGGNVLLAVDLSTNTEGTPQERAQGQAKKVLNYQTTDIKELEGFAVNKAVTITFTI